jgi:DNA repair protein RAD7
MESLADNCRSLQEVRLKEVGKIDDKFLRPLKKLTGGLRVLDLSDPGTSLSDEALIELMSIVGPTLTHLNLSRHILLTDVFLEEGLKPYTRVLTSLTLSNVPELTDDGVADFFNAWGDAASETGKPNPPLTALDLSRNFALSSAALCALLEHSGSALQRLDINGWKSTTEAALNGIPDVAKGMRWLDVGWCREVDDFVMKRLMDGCERLLEVKVWGCNRVTDRCPRKVGICLLVRRPFS